MRILFTLLLMGVFSVLCAQPTNDTCADAFNVPTVDGYCSAPDEFTTTNATTSMGYGVPMLCTPPWDGDQNDVWFVFSTTSTIIDLTISVNGATMQQPQIAVYRGDCGGFAELACIASVAGEGSVSLDVLALDPLETYYLRVNAATTGSDGDFQLCVDEFSSNIISNITTTECSGILYDTGGPDGPYGAFENFAYVICPSDPHDCVAITVLEYDIEPIFDNLSVYDGMDTDAPLVASIDGQSMGAQEFVAVETTGCVTITFTSDGGMSNEGFELTWECTQGACPEPPADFITCSGTFADSGGPNGNYPNNEMETYIICPDSAFTCLELTFTEYDIESFFDLLTIYEGSGTDGTLLGILTGQGEDVTFHNEGCFTIEFSSDFTVNNPGWLASWQCTQDMCPPDGSDLDYPDLTDCSGTFLDSGGANGDYLNNENWDFSICPADSNMCIILNVNMHEMAVDGDALTIYDGPDTTGDVLGQFFTSGANTELQSPSGCVTVAFQSNAFITAGGWDISWQCTEEECTIDTPIIVNPDVIDTDLTDVIAADGVIISNVLLDCPDGAYGIFNTTGNCNIGMENGIILTNGSAEDAEGPDSAGGTATDLLANGDADLDSLLTTTGISFVTQDACVLEFDVYAPTDMLSFNYSFGSEEYPEFAPPNSNTFNDVFGFFISGPGISGPFNGAENIALIPDTTIFVSINNLNAVTNNQYYVDNNEGLCVEYDAFTTVLTASAEVIPCETYHIKLAIADVGDGVFDSGVFIQAQSLSTGAASISPSYEYSPDIDVAIEGCATGFFTVTLDAAQPDTTVIYLNVGGTATNGDDFAQIPDSLVFLPGDTLLTIPVNPIDDGIDEGGEQAIIYLITATECGNVQTDSAIIDIQDFANISIIPESPFISCSGGEIELEASGALNYVWSNGDSTALISVTPTQNTTYTVSGTVGNCMVEDSIEIVISELDVQTQTVDISCLNNLGAITATVNGGTAPFTYNWDNAPDTSDIADLMSGAYNLTVTDANGCTGFAMTQIDSLADFSINIEQDTSGTCAASTQATVVITGQPTGDFDITYAWDDGQSTATATGLSTGPHEVTVTLADTLGNTCMQTAMVTIDAVSAIMLTLVATPEGCDGIGGTITAQIDGGTPPIQYSINANDFQTDNVFGNLVAGIYTVTAQDAEGCVATATANVENAPIPILTATSDETECGGTNGAISLMASGGTAPYQYSIDGCTTFQASPDFADLPTAIYDICVIDANQCQAINTINVLASGAPVLNTENSTGTTCGENNGTIIIEATGGVQNYEYSIDGGMTYQSDNTFSDLSGGTYTVVVTDATGCSTSELVDVAVSTSPSIDLANVSNANSCGISDGTINLFVTGGTPPLEYSNNAGVSYQSSTEFVGLGADTYTFIALDAGGCSDTITVDVREPDSPVLDSIYIVDPLCGQDDGMIEIQVSSGNPNYEYSIDNGLTFQGSNTFENLSEGVYDIVVEDFLGCVATSMVTLTQTGEPIINNLDVTPATCGDDNGTINVNVSDGVMPYSYSIDGVNFQTSSTFLNLPPAAYTVTVQDAAGCTNELLTNLTTTGSLIIGGALGTNPSSCDILDGAINIYANGGTPPYEFSIDNGTTYASTALFTDLDAGTYNVIVRDANGCVAIKTVQLATYDDPEINDIQIENTKCGEADGSIVISATGGTPNYQYSINGGTTYQGANIFTGLEGGVYDIIVEDFTGCQVATQVEINSIGAPAVTDLILKDPACGDKNGTIVITVTGGTAGYEYSIDGGMTFQSATVFNDLAGGTYNIVVKDAQGCEGYTQATLVDNGELLIDNVDLNNSLCDGENGVISVTVNGGTAPYMYSVDNGMNYQSGNVFSGLPPGTYNVVVQDANECADKEIIELTSPGLPVIDTIAVTQANCGAANGTISITASGGTPDYQYSIDGGTTFQDAGTYTGLAGGTYEVLVQDDLGCQITQQAEVTQTSAAIPQILTDGPTNFCFYDSLTLDAGSQYEMYEWSTGETSQMISTNTGGTYFVTATDADGCVGVGEITLSVTAPFTVNAGDDMTVGLAEDFDLGVVSGSSDYIYTWSGGGDSASGETVTFTADEIGTFIYTVTAEIDGCQVTDEVTITVEDRSTYDIPNAFSPNGDDLNDVFRVVASQSVQILDFKVFNRWGELVYDSPAGEWDGTFRGEQQVQDVYAYYIILQPINGESVELSGDVLLVR